MPDAAVVFVLIMAAGSIDAPFKLTPVPETVYCHPVAKSSETIASDITAVSYTHLRAHET